MAKESKKIVRPEKTQISLEIGERRVKICEAVFFKQGSAVFRFLCEEIPQKDNEISSALARLFETHRITEKKVFLNIPRHLVMARVLHLPSVKDAELKSMIRMEAVKQMPYREEDIIIGYKVIEKLKDGYSDVFLAVSQAETINRFINIAKNAGLTPEKIALSSESLAAWHVARSEMSGKKKELNPGLINIDSGRVDIGMIEEGKLTFSRAFFYDANSPEAMRKASDEIKQSVMIYQKERNRKVDKLLLSGAGGRVKAIEPILREESAFSTESIAQSDGMELAENADKALEEASFIELIGLALKSEDIKIDLLPREMAENKELAVFKKALTKTLVLFGCVVLVFLGVLAQKLFYKSGLLRTLNLRIKTMEPEVTKAKKMKGDLKIIRNEIRKKPLAIDILSEIYKVTPSGITFGLIDYESNKSLVLRGSAPTLQGVVKFIKILENSQYFENVKLKYTTKRKRAGVEKIDFEMTSLLVKIR
ncbi:MAG: pilus assembly protein PilM [Omnitrophica bacterium]|nr:pilus assembly protein PilM [Candidatus Omnitrophota bacterium]